ncbi:MAG TPA: GGDEF domain-containing protein [Longimicrobiales bacterium]
MRGIEGLVKSPVLGRALALVAPEGLLLVGIAWLDRAGVLPGIPTYAVAAVYATAALLAWRLRRTRVVLTLLALALAYPVLAPPATAGIDAGATEATRHAVAILLPLDLAVLALLADRGAFSIAGVTRFAALLSQAALVVALDASGSEAAAAWLGRELVPAAALGALPLPQPVLLSFLTALAVLTGAVLLRPDPVRRGFLWATAALLLAMLEAAVGGAASTYLLGAGLVLGVSVVETSYALAYRDGLTGLPSRRAFNEELLRLGSRYVIAMVDVDRFKGINDRHGHDVGDQVLRMVATHLARVRGGGRAFRYGGEEFAVIFAGKRLDAVVPHLERIRESIEGTEFTVRGPDRPRKKPKKPKPLRGERQVLRITVSIGAAERSPRLAEPEQVLKEADRALYRAKNAGRNRVVV